MEWFQGKSKPETATFEAKRGMVSADHSRWPLKLRCSRDQTFWTLCCHIPHQLSQFNSFSRIYDCHCRVDDDDDVVDDDDVDDDDQKNIIVANNQVEWQ